MILIFLLLALFFSSPAFGAVSFNAASSQSGIGVTSLSWNHTVTGTDTVVIGAFQGFYDVSITGMTYNSIALAPSAFIATGGSGEYSVQTFYRANATGSGTALTATCTTAASSDYVCSIMSFAGVNQTTPLGTSATSTADPLDISMTVPASGMAVDFGLFAHGSDDCAADAQPTAGGQTKRFGSPTATACADPDVGTAGTAYAAFGSTRAATGNFTWTGGGDAYTALIAVPINQAAAVTTVRHRAVIVQ